MPLVTELQNGDEVEIIARKAQHAARRLGSVVVTGKARSAIRRATRDAVRKQYLGLGRKMVERAFARAAKPWSDERLAKSLPRLARASVEDVLSAVGRGEIKARATWCARSTPIGATSARSASSRRAAKAGSGSRARRA